MNDNCFRYVELLLFVQKSEKDDRVLTKGGQQCNIGKEKTANEMAQEYESKQVRRSCALKSRGFAPLYHVYRRLLETVLSCKLENSVLRPALELPIPPAQSISAGSSAIKPGTLPRSAFFKNAAT